MNMRMNNQFMSVAFDGVEYRITNAEVQEDIKHLITRLKNEKRNPNKNKRWGSSEESRALEMLSNGATSREVAKALGRTPESIYSFAWQSRRHGRLGPAKHKEEKFSTANISSVVEL